MSLEKYTRTGNYIESALEVLWESVVALTHPDLTCFLVCACCKQVVSEARGGVASNYRLEAVLIHQLSSDETSAGSNVKNFKFAAKMYQLTFRSQSDDFINDVMRLVEVDSPHLLFVPFRRQVIVETANILICRVVRCVLLLSEIAISRPISFNNCVLGHLISFKLYKHFAYKV